METYIEGTTYGNSYRGCNVWRLIYSLKCMDSHIGNTMYGDSYRGEIYGYSFRGYNIW